MKRTIIVVLGLMTALALSTAVAQDAAAGKAEKKKSAGAEQQAARKALVEKYDANKSGRLDKEERAKMTPEDAAQWNSIAEANKAKAQEKKAQAKAKKAEAKSK